MVNEIEPAPDVIFDLERRGIRYEIIDGLPKEIPWPDAQEAAFANHLSLAINFHSIPSEIGVASMGILVKFPNAMDRYRRPDVIYIPYSRWTKGKAIPKGNAWEVLPEICVEVVSPSDEMNETLRKTEEYFKAGVSQVWLAFPEVGVVHIYKSFTEIVVFTRDQSLVCPELLPGFELPLAGMFPAEE